MKAIAAKEAKNNFGEMLDTVQREPLTIEKHGGRLRLLCPFKSTSK
jgi:prevent-host-death family protein